MLDLVRKTQFSKPILLPVNEKWKKATLDYSAFVQCSVISFALTNGILPKNANLLSTKYFSTYKNNEFDAPMHLDQYFEAIKNLEGKSVIDVVSVSNYIREKYDRFDGYQLTELTTRFCVFSNIEYHILVLIDRTYHLELLSTVQNLYIHVRTMYYSDGGKMGLNIDLLDLPMQIEALENLFISLQANIDIDASIEEILNYFIDNKFCDIAIESIQNLAKDFNAEINTAIQKAKEECIENSAINMVENLYKHHNHDYSKNECYKLLSDIFVLIIPLRKIDGNIISQLNLIRNTLYK